MSSTQLLKFGKKGKIEHFADIGNAWRGAMAVWLHFEREYLPCSNPEMAFALNIPYVSRFPQGNMQEIWDLSTSGRLTRNEVIVLRSTFDYAVCNRTGIPELVKAFREFDAETSLQLQADVIQTELDNDPDFLAIAWNQNSVSPAWQPKYNILTRVGHWDIVESLNEKEVSDEH